MLTKQIIYFIFFFLITFIPIKAGANDIGDFEIEEMSIGKSMLNFTSKAKIKNSIQPYFDDERQYYVIYYKDKLEIYDDFEIYLKTGDENFIIKAINAGLYPKNLKDCLNLKEQIVDDIAKSLNINFKTYEDLHSYYNNTSVPTSDGNLDNGYISIQCLFWDKKDKKKHPKLVNNLAVWIVSDEISQWFGSGYK